ncbi:MAG: hypothetical protein L0211_05535, partial [Planctomycetaceae bacterium]|nr:hypothetical protein [Planctomycetaceae bacterium]
PDGKLIAFVSRRGEDETTQIYLISTSGGEAWRLTKVEFAYPMPTDYDPKDIWEVCKAHVAKYPTGVLAVCTAIWALAPLTGSWLATRLGAARHPAHGYVVGALLLAMAGMNMAMLPYPIWFPIVILVTFPLGTILGARLGRGRATGAGDLSRKDNAP